jgi:hypothetical protein
MSAKKKATKTVTRRNEATGENETVEEPMSPGNSPETTPILEGGTMRSGGPRVADPNAPPVDTFGETPVHSPDLADMGPPAERFAGRGQAPIAMNELEDEKDITERIRLADKADVLYKWFRDEEKREGGSRDSVIGAIREQLRIVQGDPLPDEILNARGADVGQA